MRRLNRIDRAFTLVELIAASAIAVILMAAALSVLGLLSRDQIRLATSSTVRPHSVPVILSWDLVNAREVVPDSKGQRAVLTGYGSFGKTSSDSGNLIANNRPARVIYELADCNDVHCLMRRQIMLDQSPGEKPWSEVVAFDVTDLSLKLDDSDALTPATNSQETVRADGAEHFRQAPMGVGRKILVTITWEDGTTSQQVVWRQ